MNYYRCTECKSLITICSIKKLPEKCICTKCGAVANEWKDGEQFWKMIQKNETVKEAVKLL